MKKIKLDTKRLYLKKERIANLTSSEMSHIVGGDGDSSISVNCPTRTCVSSCIRKCQEPPPPGDSIALCPTHSTTPACPLTW